MTNKQFHRLKKQWLAEGYRIGKKQAQLNEVAPIIAAAIPVVTWLIRQIITGLVIDLGVSLVKKIIKSPDKKEASKNAFKEMFFAALKKAPKDKIKTITFDNLKLIAKPINKKLSEADGYIEPSDKELQQMFDEFKGK